MSIVRVLPAPIERGFHVEPLAAAHFAGRGRWLEADRAPLRGDFVLVRLDAYVEGARAVTDWAAAHGEVLVVLGPGRLGVRLELPQNLRGIPSRTFWVGILERDDTQPDPFELVVLGDLASDAADGVPGVAETRARYFLVRATLARDPTEAHARDLSDTHLASALAELDQSIAARPSALGLQLRADARSRLGDLAGARADLAAAVALGLPRDATLRETIRLALDAKDLAEAKGAALALGAVAPEQASTHLWIGKVSAIVGEHAAAVEAYSRALALGAPLEVETALLERARSRRAVGDAKNALADLEAWQTGRGTTPEVFLERARCFAALERWSDAAKECRAAVALGMKGEVDVLLAEVERRRALGLRPPVRRVVVDDDDE